MNHPEIATFAEFAAIARYRRSYVTELKAAGRLVLTENGKRVRVAESLQRIRDTADPSKAAVAERHAAMRGEATMSSILSATVSRTPAALDEDGEADDATEPTSPRFQEARARREHYQALTAKRDYEVSIGKLMEADQVTAAVASAITVLRTSLESLPDVFAPQLAAETDEARVRAVIAEAIEHALNETARQFHALAARAEAV